MRFHRSLVAALLLAPLAGCGGSSAEGGASASSGTHAQTLGSRGVPGGTIAVSSAGPVQPGAVNVFHIALSSNMPVPTTVKAWIGLVYDPAAEGIQAVTVTTAPGSYDVPLMVSSPMVTGSQVWIRLSFADGSVVETGSEDFPLAGH